MWFGARTLVNGADVPVVVDSVRLGEAKNLKLLKSVLVPDVQPPGRFYIYDDPATAFPRNERDIWRWHDRVSAAGARIPPGKAYELLLQIRLTAREGRFDDVIVDYHDATHRYQRTDDMDGAMGVPARRCS